MVKVDLPANLDQALSQWRQWELAEEPRVIKRFGTGENHDCFLLQQGATPLVLKLFRSPQQHAIKWQQWAATAGLAPEVLYLDELGSYAVMDYCPTLEPNLNSLAQGLKRLHEQTPPAKEPGSVRFDLLYFCDQYLSNAGDQARDLHHALLPGLDHWLNDSTPDCVCHNDLVVENCFTAGESARFIDWEYAALNNPWFDIASMLYYQGWQAQAEQFMQQYRSDWLPLLSSPLFYSASCAFLWTDILWNLARDPNHGWQAQSEKLDHLREFAAHLKISL
ncbi:MAG: phosphotransferase [Gammaproteobacteria bacterium]|nr:phosphotransferase [Gammaproteobacteria bacterium]